MRRATLGAGVALALLVSACGGSGGGNTPTTTTTAGISSTTTTSAAGAATTRAGGDDAVIPAFNSIDTCENDGGAGVASGTLQNTGTVAANFHLELAFLDDAGTELGRGSADLATLQPGDEGPWTIQVSGVGSEVLTCKTVDMRGTPAG